MIEAYYWISRYWDKLNNILQIFLTFQVAALGWLIFCSNSLEQAFDMFLSLVNNFGSFDVTSLNYLIKVLVFSLILFLVQIFQETKNDTLIILRLPLIPRYIFLNSLLLLTAMFGNFG